MSVCPQDALIDDFEDCRLTPAEFSHRRHVEVAFGYLVRLGYAKAVVAFADSLKRFAAHWGKQGLYHETITIAFVSLIHERMVRDLAGHGATARQAAGQLDQLAWEHFAERHPELFNVELLADYYSRDVLDSDLARHCFVLPKANQPNLATMLPS